MHWLTLNGRLPWTLIPLLLILALGLALRLHGLNWDSGFAFHPDERDIYMRSGCMFDLLTEASGWESCGYVKDQPLAEPGLPGLGVFLDPERSPLNPHWFPLGSILLYVMVFFRSIIELFADVNALDHNGYSAVHHAAARGDNELILYLVSRGADVTGVSRKGQTTADMANGPYQRVRPSPETVALLERLGATNNHNCVSC